MKTFTVKIRSAVDPREHVRSIEAESSTAALKMALLDFERLYPACDARHVSVSVTKKAPPPMTHLEALDRVQKLLRLAKSDNPNEAASGAKRMGAGS